MEIQMTLTESPCVEELTTQRQQIIEWVRRWEE